MFTKKLPPRKLHNNRQMKIKVFFLHLQTTTLKQDVMKKTFFVLAQDNDTLVYSLLCTFFKPRPLKFMYSSLMNTQQKVALLQLHLFTFFRTFCYLNMVSFVAFTSKHIFFKYRDGEDL